MARKIETGLTFTADGEVYRVLRTEGRMVELTVRGPSGSYGWSWKRAAWVRKHLAA